MRDLVGDSGVSSGRIMVGSRQKGEMSVEEKGGDEHRAPLLECRRTSIVPILSPICLGAVGVFHMTLGALRQLRHRYAGPA